MSNDQPTPRDMGRYLAFAQVGFEMVAPIVLGLFLDNSFGWRPWGVSAGAILGLIGGLTHLVMLANRFEKEASSKSNRDKE